MEGRADAGVGRKAGTRGMFERVLLVYSEKITSDHMDAVSRAEKMLGGRVAGILKSRELTGEYFRDIDLAVTVGGDGVFIRTAGFITGGCPVLGINSEPGMSEGALTSIMDDEMSFLLDVLEGRFRTIVRQRAEVRINGQKTCSPALNEVYAGAMTQFHASRYLLRFRGREEEQRSSGVLVVTGSGSSAWYKSIGGVPFGHSEKKLKFVVREPFSGRIFRPEILGGEVLAGEKIIFESRMDCGGIIAVDSGRACRFNRGDVAEVGLSSDPLVSITREAGDEDA